MAAPWSTDHLLLHRQLGRQPQVLPAGSALLLAVSGGQDSMAMAALLRDQPGGVTMAQFRDALGITRKYALPLANELDARGITRRRDDLRIAGPRLPAS